MKREKINIKLIICITIIVVAIVLSYIYLNKISIDFGHYDDEGNFHSSYDGEGTYYVTKDIYLERTSRYMASLFKEDYGVLLQPFVSEIGESDKFIIVKRYNMKQKNENSEYMIPNKDEQETYVIIKENEELIGPLDEDAINEYLINGTKFKYVDIFYNLLGDSIYDD